MGTGSKSLESLNEIGTFVSVVRTGSLAAASRALAVPKSTISRRISRLEAVLGVQLVHRDRRNVALTSEGGRLFDRVASSVDTISFALSASRWSMEEPRGHLRISAPADFGQLVLPKLLSEFRSMYPDISLEIMLSDRFVDLMQEGFDLAIRAGKGPDTAAAQNLISRHLMPGHHILVANAEVAAKISNIGDLRKTPFVLFRATELEQKIRLVDSSGKLHEFLAQGNCIVHDYPTMAAFILAGEGVGLLPKIHLQHGPKQLRHVLADFSSPANGVVLVYPGRQVPRRTTLLIDHLVQRFGLP